MNFILKMAWRDSRASRRRLALYSLSIVLGIAALTGIGSLGENLRRTVELQTKSLLGSDLAVTSRKPFDEATMTYFRSVGGEIATEVAFATQLNFVRTGERRLVQVVAMDGRFPFYGEAVTTPSDAMARLADNHSVVLEETLLVQFGVHLGDEVRLGTGTFQVVGALQKIPGDAAIVALFSPRVYLSSTALQSTGLLKQDGFARHRVQFKLPAATDPDKLEQAMREKFSGQRFNFDTVEERKRQLGSALKDLYSFLSLVGFVALFLGAVGVASAIHVYIRQKISTVAVLRCLGASGRTGFAIYLVQGIGLGVLGSVIGAALGVVVQFILPVVLKDFLPFQVELFIAWGALAKGTVAGLVICVLFTLLPLLAVRRVSPLVALRSALGENTKMDPLIPIVYVAIAAAVTGFAILQTGHWRTGLGFAAMMAFSFGVLAAMAKFVAWAARKFVPKKPLRYVVRQGLANLHRPNNRTVLLLLSLGLGTFLMLSLVLVRATLLDKIMGVGAGARPNLMFFDIQEDQFPKLQKILSAEGAPILVSAPIVTMKLESVRGRSVAELLKDEAVVALRPAGAGAAGRMTRTKARAESKGQDQGRIPAWTLTREYRSSYRAELGETEKISSGEWIGHAKPGESRIPISVEEGLAKELQLALGDEVVFDVQGVPMKTYVASLRTVEWQRMQPNFFILFPEGVLEPAPKTFAAATRAGTPAIAAKVQQAVARALPGISAIDLALIIQTFDSIFSKVAFVVTFMAGFTVITGIVVLAGAVMTGRYQRIRETVLLRTLGATRRQLVQIMLVEYAVLGVLATLTGGGLAVIGNALLARFVFKGAMVLPIPALLISMVAAVAITLITGLIANRGVTDHPPLEVLRQET
ncbi:MAG: FtsX-like permease family protein [Opitutaceae bacterium]